MAVIGIRDALKGQLSVALCVLRDGAAVDAEALSKEVVALVREQIGPVASLRTVTIVPALPKTRSGKILRGTMRAMADGRKVDVPGTIEDVRVLEAIAPLLIARPGIGI